jgi:hypothetical protein
LYRTLSSRLFATLWSGDYHPAQRTDIEPPRLFVSVNLLLISFGLTVKVQTEFGEKNALCLKDSLFSVTKKVVELICLQISEGPIRDEV